MNKDDKGNGDNGYKEEGYLNLVFAPRWKYTSVVRNFIQNFLAVAIAGKKTSDKIAIAASELIENSVKYSNKDEATLNLRIEKKDNKLIISVTNDADPEQIEFLKNYVDEMKGNDPLKTYLDKMQNAISRTDGKSQLGLARIQYESKAELSLKSNSCSVSVSATFNLEEGE